MLTTIISFISIIVGIMIAHLVNTYMTTNDGIGNAIGFIVAIALIMFFVSDTGQEFLIRTLAQLKLRI